MGYVHKFKFMVLFHINVKDELHVHEFNYGAIKSSTV